MRGTFKFFIYLDYLIIFSKILILPINEKRLAKKEEKCHEIDQMPLNR